MQGVLLASCTRKTEKRARKVWTRDAYERVEREEGEKREREKTERVRGREENETRERRKEIAGYDQDCPRLGLFRLPAVAVVDLSKNGQVRQRRRGKATKRRRVVFLGL